MKKKEYKKIHQEKKEKRNYFIDSLVSFIVGIISETSDSCSASSQ